MPIGRPLLERVASVNENRGRGIPRSSVPDERAGETRSTARWTLDAPSSIPRTAESPYRELSETRVRWYYLALRERQYAARDLYDPAYAPDRDT